MDGWNTILSFWDDLFSGATVSFREGTKNGTKNGILIAYAFNHIRVPLVDILVDGLAEVSFNSAINACTKRGEWQSAMILLQVTGGEAGGVEGARILALGVFIYC